MAGVRSLFVSARSRKTISLAVWLTSFLAIVGVLVAGVWLHGRENARATIGRAIANLEQRLDHLDRTLGELDLSVVGAPCGDVYMRQLRRVAFLPDGLSEFLHVEDGRVTCSLTSGTLPQPYDLGAPSFISGHDAPMRFWLDRDLEFTGLSGERGTIVQRRAFATVLPVARIDQPLPAWLEAEVVMVAPDGRWWHRAGEVGVHEERRRTGAGPGWSETGPTVRRTDCTRDGRYCISTRADVAAAFGEKIPVLLLILLFAALGAGWVTRAAQRGISRRWSFEARFLRNLDEDRLVCAYQPILDIHADRISGCELLVRWRDLDDTIVRPDAFLPIVARHGLERRLTSLLVRRAARELASRLPGETRLQVNVNIFPNQLDFAAIESAFRPLRALSDRIDVGLEIIESDAVPLDVAKHEIEILRGAGYRMYIDDFGAGYSTMRHLAGLDLDGVKLDKSFAMAPAGSILSELLDHAIRMVRSAGRKVVVEGVETAERMRQLREQPGGVEFAQGYYISRPLGIDDFVAFVRRRGGDAPAVSNRRAA